MNYAINNGRPAFPNIAPAMQVDGGPGMSLRDYFAATAVQGLIAQSDRALSAAVFAKEAYTLADAMLKAREATP